MDFAGWSQIFSKKSQTGAKLKILQNQGCKSQNFLNIRGASLKIFPTLGVQVQFFKMQKSAKWQNFQKSPLKNQFLPQSQKEPKKSQIRKKSQIIFLEPNHSKKSQIGQIWIKKSQTGNPDQNDCISHAHLFLTARFE